MEQNKALEAVLEYATGNRRWKRTPFQHPIPIQDLLLHDIQARQRTNKILVEKIEKIVLQNEKLAQQASSIYDSPSEKLRKSPIMNILMRTITTYILLHKMNNPKQQYDTLGEPLFKRKE